MGFKREKEKEKEKEENPLGEQRPYLFALPLIGTQVQI
jgi:hypothetical protein